MRVLENQRKGVAKLVSLGFPSEHTEFIMQIYSTDSTGHVAITFNLQQVKYSERYELSPLKISGSFDLDAGDLYNIVVELETLFNAKGVIPN